MFARQFSTLLACLTVFFFTFHPFNIFIYLYAVSLFPHLAGEGLKMSASAPPPPGTQEVQVDFPGFPMFPCFCLSLVDDVARVFRFFWKVAITRSQVIL